VCSVLNAMCAGGSTQGVYAKFHDIVFAAESR
jgi:hypothetical protein